MLSENDYNVYMLWLFSLLRLRPLINTKALSFNNLQVNTTETNTRQHNNNKVI